VLAFAVLAVLLAACVVGTVVLPSVSAPGVMVSQSPPVVYTPASRLQDYSIKIPASWKPGTKLGVKVRLPCVARCRPPGSDDSCLRFRSADGACAQVPSGNILVHVPKGMTAGQTFVLDLKNSPPAGARQQTLVQKLPSARKVCFCPPVVWSRW